MEVTAWVAFVGGVGSFLTPCVLPMVPVYIASICQMQSLVFSEQAAGASSKELLLGEVSNKSATLTCSRLGGTDSRASQARPWRIAKAVAAARLSTPVLL